MTASLTPHAPDASIAHTPGPWHFETVRTSCGLVHKIGPFPWKEGKPSNACIYVDYPGRGAVEAELLANARLIAAAPDLLEALHHALGLIERPEGKAIRDDASWAMYGPAFHAAISKAEGRS